MGRILNKDIQVKTTQDQLAARMFCLKLLLEHKVMQFEYEFCTWKAGILQGEPGGFQL